MKLWVRLPGWSRGMIDRVVAKLLGNIRPFFILSIQAG